MHGSDGFPKYLLSPKWILAFIGVDSRKPGKGSSAFLVMLSRTRTPVIITVTWILINYLINW